MQWSPIFCILLWNSRHGRHGEIGIPNGDTAIRKSSNFASAQTLNWKTDISQNALTCSPVDPWRSSRSSCQSEWAVLLYWLQSSRAKCVQHSSRWVPHPAVRSVLRVTGCPERRPLVPPLHHHQTQKHSSARKWRKKTTWDKTVTRTKKLSNTVTKTSNMPFNWLIDLLVLHFSHQAAPPTEIFSSGCQIVSAGLSAVSHYYWALLLEWFQKTIKALKKGNRQKIIQRKTKKWISSGEFPCRIDQTQNNSLPVCGVSFRASPAAFFVNTFKLFRLFTANFSSFISVTTFWLDRRGWRRLLRETGWKFFSSKGISCEGVLFSESDRTTKKPIVSSFLFRKQFARAFNSTRKKKNKHAVMILSQQKKKNWKIHLRQSYARIRLGFALLHCFI